MWGGGVFLLLFQILIEQDNLTLKDVKQEIHII